MTVFVAGLSASQIPHVVHKLIHIHYCIQYNITIVNIVNWLCCWPQCMWSLMRRVWALAVPALPGLTTALLSSIPPKAYRCCSAMHTALMCLTVSRKVYTNGIMNKRKLLLLTRRYAGLRCFAVRLPPSPRPPNPPVYWLRPKGSSG